jgi:hypothetical protein
MDGQEEFLQRVEWAMTPLEEIVYQAIGAASMCWENVEGAGVFQSERASAVAAQLVRDIQSVTQPDSLVVFGIPVGPLLPHERIPFGEDPPFVGHGHVNPGPMKAKCGGPAMCHQCAIEPHKACGFVMALHCMEEICEACPNTEHVTDCPKRRASESDPVTGICYYCGESGGVLWQYRDVKEDQAIQAHSQCAASAGVAGQIE